MASRDWDYALEIKGVTLNSLPIERLAEYLREFGRLLGESAAPRFAGVIKGSVVLRARETSQQPKALTRTRLRQAANDPTAPARTAVEKINALMSQDQARGQVVDREKVVLVSFSGAQRAEPVEEEHIVNDVGSIDGMVVGIQGQDDTVHVRVQDLNGSTSSIVVRDLRLARQLASSFREGAVRIQVHGTWKRDGTGHWQPHTLYGDSAVVLDVSSASDVFHELRSIPDNGWSELDDPETAWQNLRSGA